MVTADVKTKYRKKLQWRGERNWEYDVIESFHYNWNGKYYLKDID